MTLEDYSAYMKSITERADEKRQAAVKVVRKLVRKRQQLKPKTFTKTKR